MVQRITPSTQSSHGVVVVTLPPSTVTKVAMIVIESNRYPVNLIKRGGLGFGCSWAGKLSTVAREVTVRPECHNGSHILTDPLHRFLYPMCFCGSRRPSCQDVDWNWKRSSCWGFQQPGRTSDVGVVKHLAWRAFKCKPFTTQRG